jgi:hypothetical protein
MNLLVVYALLTWSSPNIHHPWAKEVHLLNALFATLTREMVYGAFDRIYTLSSLLPS